MSNPLEGAYLGPYGALNRSRGLFPGIGLNVPSGGFYWPLGGNLELIPNPGYWTPGPAAAEGEGVPACLRIADRLVDRNSPRAPGARPRRRSRNPLRSGFRGYLELFDSFPDPSEADLLEAFISGLEGDLEPFPDGIQIAQSEDNR